MRLSIIPPSPRLLKCHALLRRLVGDRIVIFSQPSQFQPSAKLSTTSFCQRRFLWTLHDHLFNLIFSSETETDEHFIYNYANAPTFIETCAHWVLGKGKLISSCTFLILFCFQNSFYLAGTQLCSNIFLSFLF